MEGYSVGISINFEEAKTRLDESWMQMFASWTKDLMRLVYGDDVPIIAQINEDDDNKAEIKIVGQYQDVKAYAAAITAEAEYLKAISDRRSHDHPEVAKKKAMLDQAISKFENLTGIEWPIK